MTNTTEIYASAAGKDSMMGIPGLVINEKRTPSQKMFNTMDKRRMDSSPYMRELASQDDMFQILVDISSACMVGLWTLSAKDPEKSADTLLEMRQWIKQTGMIESLVGGRINDDDAGALRNWFVHGMMAVYMYSGKGLANQSEKAHNLPVTGLIRMTDPANPLNYYFYQKLKVISDFTNPRAFDDAESLQKSANVSSTEQAVWYIFGGEAQRDATGEDGKKLYPNIEDKDWVNDISNLYYMKNPSPAMNDETISTIMAKRYIFRMSPVAVQLGIAPFDKLTFGSEEFPPVPAPDENIRTTNPALWQKQNAAYQSYQTNMTTVLDNLFDAVTNGKPLGLHPGIEHVRHEPKMAITGDFLHEMIDIYNDVIARSVGIPRSLIEALGNELATSRLTKTQIDILLASNQKRFADFLTVLLEAKFENQMIEEDIRVELQPLDKADQKTVAEVTLLATQAANLLSQSGCTPDTVGNYLLGSEDIPIRQVEMIQQTEDPRANDRVIGGDDEQ